MAIPIVFDQVGFTYYPNTPFEVPVLKDINLSLGQKNITAIIGHTGSGKSTLIQHLNVLLKPTRGKVIIDQREITAEASQKNLKALRKKIGVVFQFSEAQLFEETVLKDVMFGPLNFKLSQERAREIAIKCLKRVGISEALFDRSPFELSGGQMRRVAIAGVLALEPEVLVLDEPTAGLDPLGQWEILQMFMDLQKQEGLSLILVTHQMDDVARYADQVVVLEKGQVIKVATPTEIFSQPDWLEDKQLDLPHSLLFLNQLKKRLDQTNDHIDEIVPLTHEELAQTLIRWHDRGIDGGQI